MQLSVLSQSAREQGLAFLLIGGHAVIAHGHPRNTFDLDLAVPRSAVEAWRAFVLARGYTIHREGPTFIQFNPPDALSLPLDLMLVSEETYRQFEAAAVDTPVSAAGLRMVCLRHLLALKSHAIRHGHAGRIEKDLDDVIGLVRVNRINVADPNGETSSSNTDRPNSMKNSSDSNGKIEPETLDLPDWSRADDGSTRVSPDAAFALCEQYAAEMPELVKKLRAQRPPPCPVEFVL